MQTESFVFGTMQENCTIIWNEAGEAVIFDPGCTNDAEFERLCAFIDDKGLRLLGILITHPHFDHISGADILRRHYSTECWVNATDRVLLESGKELAYLYGFKEDGLREVHFFEADGKPLHFGGIRINVIPISGHTEGSLAYYVPEAGLLIAGDTLRKGSVGFVETGYSIVLERIRDYVANLPADTRIVFGHGSDSTIGEETQNNKFFKRSLAITSSRK